MAVAPSAPRSNRLGQRLRGRRTQKSGKPRGLCFNTLAVQRQDDVSQDLFPVLTHQVPVRRGRGQFGGRLSGPLCRCPGALLDVRAVRWPGRVAGRARRIAEGAGGVASRIGLGRDSWTSGGWGQSKLRQKQGGERIRVRFDEDAYRSDLERVSTTSIARGGMSAGVRAWPSQSNHPFG